MTPTEILTLAREQDIVLDVQGDRLLVDAPIGTLTPEFRSELTRQKASLVALLAPVDAFVILHGGLAVALPAVLLALDLEDRGFKLSLDAEEQVVIAPMVALTDIDLIAVGRWRLNLAAIVGYNAADDGDPQ